MVYAVFRVQETYTHKVSGLWRYQEFLHVLTSHICLNCFLVADVKANTGYF